MNRAWRWTKRIALGVIAFVVLVAAITLGVLHTDWGRDRMRRIVESQLQSTFPGSTIGRIDGSVLGDLIARDVTIIGRDKRPLATIKTLTIEAALLPLFGKTAHVTKIDAEDVVVYVHDQGPAPAEKPASTSEKSAWSIELPLVHVVRGRVELETASGTEVIDKLDAQVSMSLRAKEPLIAAVTSSAQWRGKPIAINAVVRQGDTLEVPYALASLGDARVVVAAARVDGTKIAGTLTAFAPAPLVRQLANVELPADAAVVATLSSSGQLQLSATVGAANTHVLAHVDLETKTAHAIVAAELPDVAVFLPPPKPGVPRLAARGTLVATVVANPEHLDGIIAVVGEAQGFAGSVVLGVTATPQGATLVAEGGGVGWNLAGSADVAGDGAAWTLTRSTVIARAHDMEPMRGEVIANVTATGPLAPIPSITINGVVDGRNIRYQDLSIARVHTRFAASDVPGRPTGTADIEVAGTQRGTLKIPLVTLGTRGVMHEDGTIDIDLLGHRVRTADGQTWSGSGGHVRVTEQSLAATQLASGSGNARITAQAQVGRTTDALTAKLTARDISVATYDPTLAGTVGAEVNVSRRAGLWTGTVDVAANQIAVPKRPIVDGKLAIKIDKRRVTAVATVSNPTIGSATLDLDVIGPRDITDALAWQRLERSSIQRVRIALSKIDASQLGASGSLDGELAISALDAGGKVDVKGLITDFGSLDSQLALAPGQRGEIDAHGTLHLGGVDPVDVNAVISLPMHPFDPAAWQQLGRATLREATIEAKHIAFDPDLMKRFGVVSPWRGWAAVKIKIGAEARTSDFVVDVHELRDGPLKKPVEVHMVGGSDAHGPHLDATVKTDKVTVALTAKSPLSIEAMIAGNARTAPIEATLTVPKVAARDVALVIGRDDVLGGTLSGQINVAGTIDEPTGRAVLAVDNLSIAAGIATKPPTLEKLELDARWNGMKQGFELELTGHETGGRLLKVSARGKPAEPETIVATVEAGNFDIQPFLAFAPPGSIAVGTRGLVSGVLKLKGLDLNTGTLKGRLVVTNARIPLAAELGTFRSGTFEIDVLKDQVVTKIDGKIGRGTVKGKATLRLTGSMPTAAELTLALRKVSPIGEIQPVVDADISGWFARTKTKWTGNIKIANGYVYVPPEGGNELLITGTPTDIVFIDAQKILVKPKRRPPTTPWLIATVDIGRTKIFVDDNDFNFNGIASGQLQLKLGDVIGLDGSISTERGVVEVLG
ncbi:MAG TPA: hypothetical protein VIV40_30470, partial [Kofleriaceae bacterium]